MVVGEIVENFELSQLRFGNYVAALKAAYDRDLTVYVDGQTRMSEDGCPHGWSLSDFPSFRTYVERRFASRPIPDPIPEDVYRALLD